MLEVSDLHVSYGKVEAVRGVSLTVKPGKVTLVLGANGAGKTTTLKAIAGLEKPTVGDDRPRRQAHHRPASAHDRPAGASRWCRKGVASSRR